MCTSVWREGDLLNTKVNLQLLVNPCPAACENPKQILSAVHSTEMHTVWIRTKIWKYKF